MDKAILFNIQKFSLHDGPGIRTTVFFKGCPLRCSWCHNPESLKPSIEVMHNKERCSLCGECVKRCPENAVCIFDGSIVTNENECKICSECTFYCINEAREIAGREYNLDELMRILQQDAIFYEESSGGVTLSGGEPVMQIEFIEKLLKKLKKKGIHTAVDTSGAMPFSYYERIAPFTDVFLYDIKALDDDTHKKYTGISNKNILENLKKLSVIHNGINIRIPVIDGVNATEKFTQDLINLLEGTQIANINLLPYHDISRHKYKKLNLEYECESLKVPSDETINNMKETLENKGYTVAIGG